MHSFNGPLSGTTRVSRYQKGKSNLDFTAAGDSEWQWHPLGHMQVCTALQTDNRASTPPLSFLQAFLPPNQQRQSTEGTMHAERRRRTSSKSSEQSMPAPRMRSATPPGWKSMYGVMLYTLPTHDSKTSSSASADGPARSAASVEILPTDEL